MLAPRYEGPVIGDFLSTLDQAHDELGDVFRMPFGKNDLTIICHPDLAYEILVKQNRCFVKLGADGGKPGLQRILGTGLLTNPNHESWFAHRQLIQPFFQRNQLERFSSKMIEACERLVTSWKEAAITRINLTQVIYDLTLELMFELVFSLPPEEAKVHPILVPLSLASAKRAHMKQVSKNLDHVVYPLIKQRKEDLAKGKTFDDFLDLLLRAKDAKTLEGLNDQEVRDEVLTLFAAGHETTANALLWSFKLLAEHPAVLSKLQEELGAYRFEFSVKSLKELPYLQAVFKETLRLYPAIPFAPRVTLEASNLASFSISKGTKVFVSIYSIHKNKTLWENANTFMPERFLNEGIKAAYLPFGLGEHVCVGQHLATLESQLILAALLKHMNFDLLNVDAVIPKVAISLQPKEAILATVSSR